METFGEVGLASGGAGAEGLGRASGAGALGVARGSSSSCEGRIPSAACGAMARGCASASGGGACPPPRSSRWTSWVSPLLRKMKNQNQMKTADFASCTGASAGQNLLQPFCLLCLLLIPTALLSWAWVLAKEILFSQYSYVWVLKPCWVRRSRGFSCCGWTAGGWETCGAWAGGWRGARGGAGAGEGWLRVKGGEFCGEGWTQVSWEPSLVESGSVRRMKRSCCRTERPRIVFSASPGICSVCAWVGEAFSWAGSSCAGTAGAAGWVAFLTVIYGAFWVENEMENGIGILTWTWTDLGISGESSLSPSLSPSLSYVLVMFP